MAFYFKFFKELIYRYAHYNYIQTQYYDSEEEGEYDEYEKTSNKSPRKAKEEKKHYSDDEHEYWSQSYEETSLPDNASLHKNLLRKKSNISVLRKRSKLRKDVLRDPFHNVNLSEIEFKRLRKE